MSSRRTLLKLRIYSHNLRVETDRYNKIPLDERTCPLYSDMFLSKIETKIGDIRKLSHEYLIMIRTDEF